MDEAPRPDDFAEAAPAPSRPAPLVLDLDGFEGPLDLLLSLARDQKVDLARISILQLADQYLAFIARMRPEELELAADYLVMAAWLAYLKSRLLLPEPPAEDEPGAEEMAEALAFHLRRLEAMRGAGEALVRQPRLGIDVFARGAPEEMHLSARPLWQVALYDLLKAYADHAARQGSTTLHIEPSDLYSMDDALHRIESMLGGLVGWTALLGLLPANIGGLLRRSAVSAHFVAALELARQGRLQIRQDGGTFGPIWLRPGPNAGRSDGEGAG